MKQKNEKEQVVMPNLEAVIIFARYIRLEIPRFTERFYIFTRRLIGISKDVIEEVDRKGTACTFSNACSDIF